MDRDALAEALAWLLDNGPPDARAIADYLVDNGPVQDAADVRRAVAEEIAAAIEGTERGIPRAHTHHYGLTSAYANAARIACEVGDRR